MSVPNVISLAGETNAVQALLALRDAAAQVVTELRLDPEGPRETADRLDATYGMINAPVGVRALTLISLIRAVAACSDAFEYTAPVLAPYLKQATERRFQYGPPRHQMPLS